MSTDAWVHWVRGLITYSKMRLFIAIEGCSSENNKSEKERVREREREREREKI